MDRLVCVRTHTLPLNVWTIGDLYCRTLHNGTLSDAPTIERLYAVSMKRIRCQYTAVLGVLVIPAP